MPLTEATVADNNHPAKATGEQSREENTIESIISRRAFLAATAGAAAAGCQSVASDRVAEAEAAAGKRKGEAPVPPFETLRDYVAALEAHGLVLRFDRVDQDRFEGAAIVYALIDKYGWYDAPAVIFENVKEDGKWIKGPVIVNHMGHWDTECITFGLEPVKWSSRESYRKALEYTRGLLVNGKYPEIPPVEVANDQALCKQVIETGDDIDVTKFAFITSNPADAGRYVNTGSVFTSDPEMGVNFGTYRCQIRGPKVLGVNPEPNQTGWKMLMAAKERGDKVAKISIALGQDPVVWLVSGSKVAPRFGPKVVPIDELAVAGGIRGKAIEVVKSETNDIMVPATSEMVIEGEVPLQEPMLPEGPFGEMYGYLGRAKDENFWMNITAITYRKDPWLMNQFTGATRGYVTAPVASLFNESFSKTIPGIIEINQPVDTTGWCFVKIKKTEAGQGLKVGKRLAAIVPLFKVTIVVDEDVDVLDWYEVGLAVGARYTPTTSTEIFSGRGMPLDPSSSEEDRYSSSKLVIDATRQWPEEGGPQEYAQLNRTLLEELAPESFDIAMKNWGDVINTWGKTRY
jgi:4-hydroxy-3-polyprenylbenzoate decarboxylase